MIKVSSSLIFSLFPSISFFRRDILLLFSGFSNCLKRSFLRSSHSFSVNVKFETLFIASFISSSFSLISLRIFRISLLEIKIKSIFPFWISASSLNDSSNSFILLSISKFLTNSVFFNSGIWFKFRNKFSYLLFSSMTLSLYILVASWLIFSMSFSEYLFDVSAKHLLAFSTLCEK